MRLTFAFLVAMTLLACAAGTKLTPTNNKLATQDYDYVVPVDREWRMEALGGEFDAAVFMSAWSLGSLSVDFQIKVAENQV